MIDLRRENSKEFPLTISYDHSGSLWIEIRTDDNDLPITVYYSEMGDALLPLQDFMLLGGATFRSTAGEIKVEEVNGKVYFDATRYSDKRRSTIVGNEATIANLLMTIVKHQPKTYKAQVPY